MDDGAACDMLLPLLIMVVCGLISAGIARSKGRNIVGWFFAGFLLQIPGIIIIAVLPNLNEQRAKETRHMIEQRRLREQLRQERMKNEAFRRHAAERLDQHDSALGVDTRQTALRPPGNPQAALPRANPGLGAADPVNALAPQPPLGFAPPQPQAEQQVPRWYYERGGQAIGPVTEDTIRRKFASTDEIQPQTLVWSEDLGTWTPIRDVPLFGGGSDW
jgi:hypothetical protein